MEEWHDETYLESIDGEDPHRDVDEWKGYQEILRVWPSVTEQWVLVKVMVLL